MPASGRVGMLCGSMGLCLILLATEEEATAVVLELRENEHRHIHQSVF